MLASQRPLPFEGKLKKILVIQTAFLGDCVLATAILESLHNAYPEAALHFLINAQHKGLFVEHPFLAKLWLWDITKKYKSLFQLIKDVRAEGFDAVINLQRYAATGLITLFSGAKFTAGFDKNPMSQYFTWAAPHAFKANWHETDRNFELIKPLGCQPAKPSLYPTASDTEAISHLIKPTFITIAPYSVWATKTWPEEKWLELIERFAVSTTVYLLGGNSEKDRCEILKEKSQNHRQIVNLAGKLPLLQSAALMKGAAMNYCNDSGPVHLASAMNAPVTLVYCSTTPLLGFGPVSDVSFVVQSNLDLLCRPCGITGKSECPLGHFLCANSIYPTTLTMPNFA